MTAFETPLRLGRAVVGHRCVLRVAGEVDVLTAPELRAAVSAELEAGARELWIDLSGTEFLDSSGVHVLMEARERLRALNRSLTVICPDGTLVRRVLEVSGAVHVLSVHPSVGAAHRAA